VSNIRIDIPLPKIQPMPQVLVGGGVILNIWELMEAKPDNNLYSSKK
jgi:hypothetical protein